MMNKRPKALPEYKAAVLYGFSPTLLRWLTKNPIIDSTLLPFKEKNGIYYYEVADLDSLNTKMNGKWPVPPKGTRPIIPTGIRREILAEARNTCPVCHTNIGEIAHIYAVANTYCNHPRNLVYLCPNHHTLYDYGYKLSNITVDEVLILKEGLQIFQKTIWKIKGAIINTYLGALNATNSLLQIHDVIQKTIPDADFNDLLSKIAKSSSKTSGKPLSNNILSNFKQLKVEVKRIRNEQPDELCRLCLGKGQTSIYDTCPVCFGEGAIEGAADIDISKYEPTQCPLCNGKGRFNGDDCPECRGEGEISGEQLENYDGSIYEMVKCPLCNGKKSFRGDDCPECRGEGEISGGQLENYDGSIYEMVKCPLCKGKKSFRGDDCPECRGEGEISGGQLENYDGSMSYFQKLCMIYG
jgi:RecJ-like exonuclease